MTWTPKARLVRNIFHTAELALAGVILFRYGWLAFAVALGMDLMSTIRRAIDEELKQRERGAA